MYPGGGPEWNKDINGPGEPPSPYGSGPGQQPQYPVPQDPFVTDPGYVQPPFPPPAHDPGYHQQGYPPQSYPPVAPYPAPPPAAATPPGQGVVFAVAAVAIFSILAVVGVAVWVVTSSNNEPAAGPAVGTSAPAPSSPAAEASPGTADPVEGLVIGSGSVRVDVYVDYQCPPCSLFEESTGEVLAGYVAERRVTLSIHPVAFIDERSKNRYATRAAAAMACAYENGKGAEFHAYLLSHQPAEDTAGPTDEDLIDAGDGLGLDEDFDSCVSDGDNIDWVDDATDAADDYGVSSVPAVYVDDHAVKATKSSLVTAIDNAR